MLSLVALVRTDVSEERSDSIIRASRIGELGTMLAVTSNAVASCFLFLVHRLLSLWLWRGYAPPKGRFLQEPHGVTSQKTAFSNVFPAYFPFLYEFRNAFVTGNVYQFCPDTNELYILW
jgi:hypothetical protein